MAVVLAVACALPVQQEEEAAQIAVLIPDLEGAESARPQFGYGGYGGGYGGYGGGFGHHRKFI